jgi:hypothetical protein
LCCEVSCSKVFVLTKEDGSIAYIPRHALNIHSCDQIEKQNATLFVFIKNKNKIR